MKARKISWDKQAINYFRESIRYIRKISPQNADKVKTEILEKISQLSKRPEIYPPDKYKSKAPETTGHLNFIASALPI